MGITKKVMGNAKATSGVGSDLPVPDTLSSHVSQALHPLTPLLVAAAFAVTAMTLVGSLLVA